jgi:hypothetical protein
MKRVIFAPRMRALLGRQSGRRVPASLLMKANYTTAGDRVLLSALQTFDEQRQGTVRFRPGDGEDWHSRDRKRLVSVTGFPPSRQKTYRAGHGANGV